MKMLSSRAYILNLTQLLQSGVIHKCGILLQNFTSCPPKARISAIPNSYGLEAIAIASKPLLFQFCVFYIKSLAFLY